MHIYLCFNDLYLKKKTAKKEKKNKSKLKLPYKKLCFIWKQKLNIQYNYF